MIQSPANLSVNFRITNVHFKLMIYSYFNFLFLLTLKGCTEKHPFWLVNRDKILQVYDTIVFQERLFTSHPTVLLSLTPHWLQNLTQVHRYYTASGTTCWFCLFTRVNSCLVNYQPYLFITILFNHCSYFTWFSSSKPQMNF